MRIAAESSLAYRFRPRPTESPCSLTGEPCGLGSADSRVRSRQHPSEASRGPGGGDEPPVAGMEPAKSCMDASSNESIVYRAAKTEGQMAVCSVPGDTIPALRWRESWPRRRRHHPPVCERRPRGGRPDLLHHSDVRGILAGSQSAMNSTHLRTLPGRCSFPPRQPPGRRSMPVSGDGRHRGWRLLPGPDLREVGEQGDDIHRLGEVAVERRWGRHAVLAVAGDGDEDTSRSSGSRRSSAATSMPLMPGSERSRSTTSGF